MTMQGGAGTLWHRFEINALTALGLPCIWRGISPVQVQCSQVHAAFLEIALAFSKVELHKDAGGLRALAIHRFE